jgi:putative heme-binding domain-containing protein
MRDELKGNEDMKAGMKRAKVVLASWVMVAALLPGVWEVQAGPAEALGRLTTLLVETDDAEVRLDILRGMSAGFRGQQRLPMPEGWAEVERRLGGSGNAEIRTLVQTLSLTFGSQAAMESLRRTAQDANAEVGARRAAMESLLAARDPGMAGLLQKLVRDPAVRGLAIRSLAAFDEAGTPGLLLGEYGRLGPAERRDALGTLASRAGFAQPLLAAVASGKVARTDLTAEVLRQLKNLKNAEVDRMVTEVWGVMRDTSPDMAKEVARYKALYWKGGSTPGDASRGRLVFNQVCAQCHRLFDSGGAVGPDITGANRSDLDYLLENILYPDAVIPNEYRQTLIEMKDGRLISGIVKGQEGGSVLVQTANEVVRVATVEIEKREQAENSMMPEGLIAQLEDQQFRDLLYYLSRPGQVPLPSP